MKNQFQKWIDFSKRFRCNPISLCCIILIAAGYLLLLRLTLTTGDLPWFISVLKIDGPSYIKGMESIASSGDFLNLGDIYHSPGYQIYLGVLKKLYPWERGFFFLTKLISGILFLLTVTITVFIGERKFGKGIGWIAGAILAFSLKMHVYSNLLQGEVLQGFCFALLIFILIRWNPEQSGRGRFLPLIWASLIASFLTLLQARFLPIVPLIVFCIILKASVSKRGHPALRIHSLILFLLPWLVLIGFWSLHHSLSRKDFIFIGTGSEFRLKIAYNPNATGASYPYPEIVKPTGLSFVINHPGKFLWLLRERYLYLWDWKPDIWNLGNPIYLHLTKKIIKTRLDIPMHVIGTLLCFIGISMRFAHRGCGFVLRSDCFLIAWGIAVTAAPMLVFASSRFLIPALPMIALYQAYPVATVVSKLIDRTRFKDQT